ncbi:hypothetical protein [Pseudomarimonas arenosa]|uniref:Uncharacterized protein n=1 Tax=Pseudomarimonas arenosa TaxID=2774145 RepID=A0AAW3ZF55_9GAMM|nr:hypothetical protein [Pseudomarimonas arenosa]MBD8524778.1 hypothetical protein [Pseudomarimonas arenosa]
MRTRLTLLALAASVVMASGCATNGSRFSARNVDMSADTAYMAKVEAVARRRGVDVQWVNPPRVADRRIAAKSD